MKKLIILWAMLLFPCFVHAANVNYDITNFLVDATVLEDGSMHVEELIVLKGNFNGYIRELAYKNSKLKTYTEGNIDFANSSIYNASGIQNVKLYTKKIVAEEISFDTMDEIFTPLVPITIDRDAKNGNYYYERENDILSYKMYQSANNETVAFLITYQIDDVVVMHEDVAELYWTFIGNGFTDEILNLQIQVHLPEKDYQNFYFWAHGDITGEIERTKNNTVLATMKKVDKNSVIDLRMIFDLDTIKNAQTLRHSKQQAFEEIWKIEEERAEKANKQRETIRFMLDFTKKLTLLYFLVLIILWIYIYIKFDKEYKSEFDAKYYREFTGDYNVEVIDYLMNKNITPNAMSASIMNLIYKKNIKVEKKEDIGKKKQYEFELLNNNQVTDTEQVLLDFLFEEVGKEKKFTNIDLEKYAKSTKTCEKFTRRYTDWKNCVTKDAERERFYETNGIPIVSSILMLLFAILIFMVTMYYHVEYVVSYFVFTVAIIFLFYTIFIRKRTRKGNEHYLRWKAFKNFLNDFGNFQVKELPEITLWEKYLVYATVFGLADKVEKSMNVKIKEYTEIYPGYTNLDFGWNWYLYHTINESIHTAYSSSIQATQANAASKNSSNGFGGGFSSGAGFGGGGGGGHGF